MKEEQLEYADKILRSLPEDVFEHKLFNREQPNEDNPNPSFPSWHTELLLQLVGDGLLSKKVKLDAYDGQTKLAYSIKPEGSELVSNGVTYKAFLIKKENRNKEEKIRRRKDDYIQDITIKQSKWAKPQIKFGWVLTVITIIVSILALILS